MNSNIENLVEDFTKALDRYEVFSSRENFKAVLGPMVKLKGAIDSLSEPERTEFLKTHPDLDEFFFGDK